MAERGPAGRLARRAERSRGAREAEPTTPPAHDPATTVAFLQRMSGNAAVTRMIQRYEGGEHAMLGGSKRELTIQGVKLSEGDLIALGDLYETPEQMAQADKAELQKLAELIARDKKAYETRDKSLRVGHEEWEAATAGRAAKGQKTYMELAKENVAHFAPPKKGSVGTDHKSEWERLHKQALDEAHKAASGDKKVPEQARIVNGFASHFLTDAFAAGHIVAKSDIMDAARANWDKIVQKNQESTFTDAVAKRVLADSGAKAKLAKLELDIDKGLGPLRVTLKGDFTEPNLSRLLGLIATMRQESFLNAFAKLVHDQLNELKTEKGGGLDVENDAGKSWRLSGDATLAFSEDTQKYAKAAVAESNKNLELAARATGALNYTDLFKNVWKHVPKPTKQGNQTILDLITTFADPANKKAVDEFATLMIEELDIGIEELKKEGFVKDKPAGKPSPGRPALPAPSRA